MEFDILYLLKIKLNILFLYNNYISNIYIFEQTIQSTRSLQGELKIRITKNVETSKIIKKNISYNTLYL